MLTKPDAETTHETGEQLRRLARQEFPPHLRVKPLVCRGTPAREILRVAAALEVDLIILAAHRRSLMSRLRLGSTAAQVERHAPCPVLMVRYDSDSGVEAALWQEARGVQPNPAM